jgi:hypothetical protein
MSELVWYSEIALAYLLSSFVVATIVGRVLRQASQPDLRGLELRSVDRPIGKRFAPAHKERAQKGRRDILTLQ